MKLTASLIRQAADGIDSLGPCVPRPYSGRSMNGTPCAAIGVDDLGTLQAFGMSLAYLVADRCGGVARESATDAIDAAISDFDRPLVDSDGEGFIAYWPDVPYDTEDES